MQQVLLVVDVQPSFSPPLWMIDGIRKLAEQLPSVATVEQHNEAVVPFQRQLNWAPSPNDECLIKADRIFVKHGYLPPQSMIDHLLSLNPDRVLVCGVQTDTCLLAAGFCLFDAGLQPTLLADLTQGSSLDRTGKLGTDLWRHHFGQVINDHREIEQGKP